MISNLTIIALIILCSAATLGWCMYKALNKWQPMETAPKDGTTIIIANKWGEWGSVYDENYGEFVSGKYLIVGTRWRHVTKFD